MALTIGTGPFGERPAGTFNQDISGPARTLYWEPSPKRVRVVVAGETVADSTRVKLLHETGLTPVYYFPQGDVRSDLLEPSDHRTHCPFKGDASYHHVVVGDRRIENAAWYYPEPLDEAPPIEGHIAFYWDKVDRWFEEDEEVGVHPRDPYTRIDVIQSSRHVEVIVGGETIAESDRPTMLFETGLPPRFYLPPEDVRSELLVDSDRHTECPYKGTASYHSVKAGEDVHEDLIWYYPEPHDEVAGIAGLLSFYNEKVDLIVDGEAWERPVTRLS